MIKGSDIMRNLKTIRKSKNITQKQVADYLHMSESTYCLYEKGSRTPTPDTVSKLADYFKVSTDYLLGRTDEIEIKPYEDNVKEYANACFIDYTNEKIVRLPILGGVSAGLPELAIQEFDEYEYAILPKNARDEDYFWLRVKGDSMEPTLFNNYFVLVQTNAAVKNNDVAVVALNGDEATIKRYKYKPDGSSWLYADNKKYLPIKLTVELRPNIIGKVVKFMGNL